MSSSARKIKLHIAPPKPRNPLVAQAAQRKAGSHRKSKSAERNEQKRALRQQLKEI
jgi:hypothetical protein